MLAPAPRYLLDTNVLLAYCRGSDLGKYIESNFHLMTATQVPIISIVCEGEIRSLAKRQTWQASKIRTLNNLLGHFVRINLDFPGVIDAYADIENYSQTNKLKGAANMGKNDLWIAATAKVTGTHLLTTDKDFDHLDGIHLTRHYIDPNSK